MIPYISVHNTYSPIAKEIGHKIKGQNASGMPISDAERDYAIRIAASSMARLLPKDCVLVPIPSHRGYATDTLLLAREIGKMAKKEVADILRGFDRTSSYEAKKNGEKVDFGFYMTHKPDKPIVYIDNVIASGATARAAYEVHRGLFLVYVCVGGVKGFTQYRTNTNVFSCRRGMPHKIL